VKRPFHDIAPQTGGLEQGVVQADTQTQVLNQTAAGFRPIAALQKRQEIVAFGIGRFRSVPIVRKPFDQLVERNKTLGHDRAGHIHPTGPGKLA
jgi:hypothetical protein